MKLEILMWALLNVVASEQTKMYVRKTRMQDQASASSGYLYHTDSSGPSSYVRFSGTSGDLSHLGYPLNDFSNYDRETQESLNYYYPSYHHSNYNYNPTPFYNRGLFKNNFNPEKYGYGYGKSINDLRFDENIGEKYDTSKHSDAGEKGERGYKSGEKYEEGFKGSHDNEEQKGYYDNKGGDKEGHHESSNSYGSKSESANGSKGSSFSESGGHKKGSKTTGYHKVYHKDEYKKDHSFYDESDKRGHFDKYGSADSHHSSENGASEKGEHFVGGFHENEQDRNGKFDKGHYDINDSKFLEQAGGNKYHRQHSEFGRDREESDKKLFGY